MPFSLRPDVNDTNERGEHVIKESNPYIGLGGHPDFIYYTPNENKYWVAEGVELDLETFMKKFEQRLHWKFDRIEKDKNGKEFNAYPPSTKNIAETRKIIAIKAAEEGNILSKEEILFTTSPVCLDPDPKFAAQLDKSNGDEKLARRLNSSSRY